MLFEPAWSYTREVKTSVTIKALEERLEGRNVKWSRCKWSEVKPLFSWREDTREIGKGKKRNRDHENAWEGNGTEKRKEIVHATEWRHRYLSTHGVCVKKKWQRVKCSIVDLHWAWHHGSGGNFKSLWTMGTNYSAIATEQGCCHRYCSAEPTVG